MGYQRKLRLPVYRRAVQEVAHLLNNPELFQTTSLVATFCLDFYHRSWQSICLLKNMESDYFSFLHIFDALLIDHPQNTWLRCMRAFLLCGISYYSAAREDVEYVLMQEPKHLAAKLILAEVWRFLKEYENAFTTVTDALRQEPMCIRAYMDRVVIVRALAHKSNSSDMQKNYYRIALADLERLQILAPSDEIDIHMQAIRLRLEKLSEA